MAKDAGLGHIDSMVFSGESEPLVEFIGGEWFVLGEEVVGLLPGRLALIGGIIAAGVEREGGVVDEHIDFLLDVLCEGARVGPGFIHILEDILDWDCRHKR